MKNIKIFEKDFNKCSRCGLCQAVCPVFEVTKNDCTSPKGKFIMLKDLLSTLKKPSKKMKSYMKACLNCGKCFDYCPAKIDTVRVNEAFKKDYPQFNFDAGVYLKFIDEFFKSKFQKNSLKEFLDKNEGKRIVYLQFYGENGLENLNPPADLSIVECGAPIEFIISNCELFELLSKKTAQKILNLNPDFVVTNNLICKIEAEKGLKAAGVKIDIIYLN